MTRTTHLNAAHLRYAATVMDEAVETDRYPNGVLAVAACDGLQWSHVAPGRDGITFDSIFPLASITKPIIGLAIMQLVERGRLLLHNSVTTYIPEFAQNGKEAVTVWHLLTHTSGMVEDEEALEQLWAQKATSEGYLRLAIEAELKFPPGNRSEYCNVAFLILAELITRLGGLPYPQYLDENIFVPLGMTDTAFVPSDSERAAPVHNFGTPADVAQWNSLAAPHGGLWSTASDLVKLGQALLNRGRVGDFQLLSPAALDTMTRLQKGVNAVVDGQPQPASSALAWGKSNGRGVTLDSDSAFTHGGATGTFFHIDPQWNLIYICLSSRWESEHDPAMRALNAVYGALREETL